MVKIIHERSKCVGCGACESVCPEMFEMTEDGKATLKNSKKNGEVFELKTKETDCLKNAADVCPVKIIRIEK
ncbi:MAG: ferredoxin [Parcubacteria group bacterium Athens1014_26]|nr:MAG: ferredoxin [Parcubacteria group bacterium Athens1014_26]